jgi:protoporphyrinogen/coproporphyrinogen III oxidase
MRVAIIGAGISGLSLAYYLQKLGIAHDLFEASSQVGGNLRTLKIGNYLLELGPNCLYYSPELYELIRELKLEQEIMAAAPAKAYQYIVRNGVYYKIPLSPFSLLSNDIFSWKTKYRLSRKTDVPLADIGYETISQSVKSHFRKDNNDHVVNPFIKSFNAGYHYKNLNYKASLELNAPENEYGSVLTGIICNSQGISPNDVFSFTGGINTLPNAIAEKLISLHTEHKVEVITRNQGKYIISCTSSGDYDTEEYQMVVLALPAYQAAEMLLFIFPEMADALRNINYPPLAMVYTVYNRHDVESELSGFGALNPKFEDSFAAGSFLTSSVFEGRCSSQEILLTTFVCGLNALTERSMLMLKVHNELCKLYNIKAEKPLFQYTHLWEHSIPQYDINIENAYSLSKELEKEGMFVSSNWQAGISVTNCIRHSKELAHKINLKRPLVLNS